MKDWYMIITNANGASQAHDELTREGYDVTVERISDNNYRVIGVRPKKIAVKDAFIALAIAAFVFGLVFGILK